MSKSTLNRTSSAAVLSACMVGNTFDGNAIATQIKWIAQTGPKLDATIHAVAVACIGMSMPHAEGGHNCPLRALQLCQTLKDLNKSVRLKALIAWFTAMSNLRLKIEGDKVTGGVLKPTMKGYRDDITIAAADAKPFWSVEEKDVDPAAFDDDAFAAAVAKLIKRAKSDNASLSPAAATALADLEALGNRLPKKETVNA